MVPYFFKRHRWGANLPSSSGHSAHKRIYTLNAEWGEPAVKNISILVHRDITIRNRNRLHSLEMTVFMQSMSTEYFAAVDFPVKFC